MGDLQPAAPEPGSEPKPISARVPEKVARGVFANGFYVTHGPNEFVLDFAQRMVKPFQVAARVILPAPVVPGLLRALNENLENFTARFGALPVLLPVRGPMPTLEEVYDDMKLADEIAAGAFANAIMVTHSPSEVCLDFISNLFPRPQVASRIYLAASHLPGIIDALTRSYHRYQQRTTPPSSEK